MAKIAIGAREWELAPYKLGAMIAAAPFIDAQKGRQAEISARAGLLATDSEAEKAAKLTAATTMVEMMQNIADAVRVLHVGIVRQDPTVTVESLIDDVDPTPENMTALIVGMQIVLRASGMKSGEAAAPSAAEMPAGA